MDRALLRELAKKASELAHSPYSKAKIGSAVFTADGKYYSGCNVENSSYGATVCAERDAIFKAISEGSKQITAIYVYSKDGWPPCGMCRQVMTEFSDVDLVIIYGNEKGLENETTLGKLFPCAFTPEHLK